MLDAVASILVRLDNVHGYNAGSSLLHFVIASFQIHDMKIRPTEQIS